MQRHKHGPFVRSIIVAAAILMAVVPALTVLPASTALAQPVAGTVGNGTPGSCTWSALGQALDDFDEITFNCGPAPHTITRTSNDSRFDIFDRKVVDGGGIITLDADRSSNHFRVVHPDGNLLVRGLTFTGGWSVFGGALENQTGTLEVIDSAFFDNLGTEGGAIYAHNGGKTTITNSTFDQNRAEVPNSPSTSFRQAGAIFNGIGSELYITNSTFTGNTAYNDAGAIRSASNSVVELRGTTFEGNSSGRDGGALLVHANSQLIIEDSSFDNNSAVRDGGVLRAAGRVNATIRNATFTGNSSGQGEGGALFVREYAELTIEDSTFTNNSIGYDGGAIHVWNNATATIHRSTFNENESDRNGGAIYARHGASLNVYDSTFNGNTGDNRGGAIHSRGVLTVLRSTFNGNHSVIDGGAIWNHHGTTATIEASTFRENSVADNSGGAIFNQTNSTMHIKRSTFLDNAARNGGAIYSNQNGAITNIENSTFNGNTARHRGAAVVNAGGQVSITSSTIVDNVADIAGGISVRRNTAVTTVSNTIIVTRGVSTNCEIENAASIVSNGYNIFDDSACPANGTSDFQDADPAEVGLLDLADNGGPTLTHMLSDTSIAIDTIPAGNCPGVDQRGFDRPAGTLCDIGAVEHGATNAALPVALPATAETSEDTPVTLSLTATIVAQETPTFQIQDEPHFGTLTITGSTLCNDDSPRVCTIESTYIPDTDFFGADTFTFTATGTGGTSSPADGTITVVPVNDPPSFTTGADQTVNENSGAQTVPGWAQNISPGPANESVQAVSFIVTNDNNSLFSQQPSVSSDGTLAYTPADGEFGSATVTVSLQDNGGTGNGGSDTSGQVTFTITVLDVANPPVIDAVTNNGPVPEGSPAVITVSLESGHGATYAFDCDNDLSYETGPLTVNTATCTYPDDGEYQVNVLVTNEDGDDTLSTTVTVQNANPSIDSIETDINESQVTVTVLASDPGVDDELTYRFDCDNDSVYEIDAGATNSTICEFGSEFGDFTINVQVQDDDLGSTSGSTSVQIANPIPDTTLCAHRFTGVVFYPTDGRCGSMAIAIEFPVVKNTTVCALALIGTLRVSPAGFCLPFIETRYRLPDDGPLTVCIHEQSGLVRLVNERHPCHRTEIRRIIG